MQASYHDSPLDLAFHRFFWNPSLRCSTPSPVLPTRLADTCVGCRAVSAGFATMHGNNTLTINAVEAYELDKFSSEVCSALSTSLLLTLYLFLPRLAPCLILHEIITPVEHPLCPR